MRPLGVDSNSDRRPVQLALANARMFVIQFQLQVSACHTYGSYSGGQH